jgi:hypothetical protein
MEYFRQEKYSIKLKQQNTKIKLKAMTINILFALSTLTAGIIMMVIAFKARSMPAGNFVVQNASLLKAVAAFMVVSGSYSVVNEVLKSEKAKVEWTTDDKLGMIKYCIRDSGPNAQKYPNLITQYCACSVENIAKNIKKEDYLLMLKRNNLEDLVKAQSPYIKDCLDELNREIERVKGTEKE